MSEKRNGNENVNAKLIATAAELFISRGLDGASLKDISTAAGVAKGTLYYYYPAKDELVADVAASLDRFVTNLMIEWVESLEREEDPRGALARLIDAFLDDESRTRLYVVLMAGSCTDNARLKTTMNNIVHRWTVMFEMGAYKLKMPESKLIRERTNHFFPLLTGLIIRRNTQTTKDPELDKDLDHIFRASFIRIFSGSN